MDRGFDGASSLFSLSEGEVAKAACGDEVCDILSQGSISTGKPRRRAYPSRNASQIKRHQAIRRRRDCTAMRTRGNNSAGPRVSHKTDTWGRISASCCQVVGGTPPEIQ